MSILRKKIGYIPRKTQEISRGSCKIWKKTSDFVIFCKIREGQENIVPCALSSLMVQYLCDKEIDTGEARE